MAIMNPPIETPRRRSYLPGPPARTSAARAGNRVRLSRALGWFSLGLGLSEVTAPDRLSRLIGVPARRGLFRILGMREIASGLAILSSRQPARAMQSRVLGDLMDLSLLGIALNGVAHRRSRTLAATATVAAVTLVDYLWSRRLTAARGQGRTLPRDEAIRIGKSVTVNRPVEECYRFWRSLENLPRFMDHLESVRVIDAHRSHWVARGPVGSRIEWDAELINDVENEVIAWRSLAGSAVDSTGAVRFERAPGGRGTVIRLKMHYSPPGGAAGAFLARLFGEAPEQQISEDFRRFKQLLETGETTTITGQAHGGGALRRVKGS